VTRESALQKGLRYLTEGRLRVLEVDEHAGTAVAECRGNGARYIVGHDLAGWFCSCPARSTCAHMVALQHVVTLEPRDAE
jgi:uncharacterized Zn finger protein